MNEKTLQIINHGILSMRDLLYSNIIYAKDFINCIIDYNKKYKIKMKTELIIKDGKIIKYFIGNIGKENIYNIPVINTYLEDGTVIEA